MVLKTELSSPELLAHYGGQLEKEGWVFESEGRDSAMAFQSRLLEDAAGGTWHALLIVRGPEAPAARREVILRISALAGGD